jgi:hypothetical protein
MIVAHADHRSAPTLTMIVVDLGPPATQIHHDHEQ